MTLNGQGNQAAVFVFKIGTTLTTASNASVSAINGASSCNIFWQLGSSGTLGTTTAFLGDIFASASITVATGATVHGGLYALNGAVTLDSNPVTSCPGVQMGSLQVCKVAGSAALTGTSFQFSIAGTPPTVVNVAAGPSPGGTCSTPLAAPAQATVVTETIPAGTTLAAVSTLPSAGLLIGSNLGAGTANVQVNPNAQTVVTFIDTLPPPPATGLLQICKIAGSGVTLSTPFVFNVNVAGTALAPVTVPAGVSPGNCSAAQQVPIGQALISETLPAGTKLTAVTALPNAALLVGSNLAAGTATVTIAAAGLTIATFTNTVTPTTGTIQVCNVAGTGVSTGTNFTCSVGGTPVVVPAGAAPGGTCSVPISVPAGSSSVIETLPVGMAVTSVSTSPGSSLVSSDLTAGTAVVSVGAGANVIATFVDAMLPPVTGFLQVCKVAGAGVAVGTNFTFNIAGTPPTVVTVAAGSAPGGSCGPALVVPAGQALITETLPAGTVLTAVTTLPAGSLLASNLTAGSATATVAPGAQTIVTFVDTVASTNGFLQICKVAGAGISVGTNFTFTVAGTPVVVAAGAAPTGSCGTPLPIPAGQILIAETLPAGTALTSVNTLPAGSLVSTNLAAGTAVVQVNTGAQTIATFLDTVIPAIPSTGFLQICKVAGAGVAVGTNFTFSVAGNPLSVSAGPAPSGSCSTAFVMPAGAVQITEAASPGAVLAGVSTFPAGLLLSSNLAAGTATVTVNVGGQTIVTFLNTVASPTGLLKINSIAGTGVPVGGVFSFNVAGASLAVPAGSSSQALVFPLGTPVTVTEAPSSGTVLSAINVLPANAGVVNLAGRMATLTVGAGETDISFTNTAGGVGLLKVCKVAGTGVTAGTNFMFSIAGVSFSVPAGYCVSRGTFPVGTPVTITELASPSTVLSAIQVLPVGRTILTDIPNRTATATVDVGVTQVNFTNSKTP